MLHGFSLNVLPIFMVLTQWYQMRLNPMQLRARNERGTKNKCKNDALYALHVLGLSLLFLIALSSLLDRSEFNDYFTDSFDQKCTFTQLTKKMIKVGKKVLIAPNQEEKCETFES